MTICYVNPDGSHVRGCDVHTGQHPADWCDMKRAERRRRIAELESELHRLRTYDIDIDEGTVVEPYEMQLRPR